MTFGHNFKTQFQRIFFVDSSEIRLWKYPGLCQMIWSWSTIHFTKSSKMMFLCCSETWNDFKTQFTFDKWFGLNASCSFLTASWNFLLLHVWWLNNSQSCLLPPFLFFHFFCSSNGCFFIFFRQFRDRNFCCYHLMERILRP